MQIDSSQHADNYNTRGGANIAMIVVHNTEGTRQSDIPILLGHTSRKVSVHYYIQRDGKVYQFVPDSLAAWHAGVSSWLGHGSAWIRDHSIGIELENLNTGLVKRQDYTTIQMSALTELTRDLVHKYHIDSDYLVRHLDIAPGRKADPAFFDWTGFKALVFAGGVKPQTLVADSTPDVIPPETPYQTDNADWLPNPALSLQTQINTAADTAVSTALSGLWSKLATAWSSFLDSLGGKV